MSSEPANEGNGYGDASGGRHEVLHSQRRHLYEIAHGRLAAVPLPVRVRHEAHGGIERLVGTHLTRPESLRIERQDPLKSDECVREQEREEAEREEGTKH